MTEELNLIEEQILRIFKAHKKKANEPLSNTKVLEEAQKGLTTILSNILKVLIEKGLIVEKEDSLVLTAKGDDYLYKYNFYSDY
ncbi:MAG: hypothetical protein WDA74_03815 [Spirochaetota bacterium]